MTPETKLMQDIDTIPFNEGFQDAFFCTGLMLAPCIYIAGNPIFTEIDFLNLKPGDKVIQVGDKVSGSAAINRIDNFLTFVIYQGILKTKLLDKDSNELQLLLFKMNPEELKTVKIDDKYIAYIILRNEDKFELKVPDPKNNVNLIYQPVFKKTI